MEHHYVYRVVDPETQQFYIGSRTCNCKPGADKEYKGSPYVWEPEFEKLTKSIVKTDFRSREEAIEYEAKLIKQYIDNELNENYYIPNEGFHTAGRSHSDETKSKIRQKMLGENNPNYGLKRTKHSKRMSGKNNPCYNRTGSMHPLHGIKRPNVSKRMTINNPMKQKHVADKVRGSKNGMAKKCVHIKSNTIYDTMTNAANSHNISIACVKRHCNNEFKNQKFKLIHE